MDFRIYDEPRGSLVKVTKRGDGKPLPIDFGTFDSKGKKTK